MAIHISVVQEIKERLARGERIKAVAADTNVTERTIRRWQKNGFPGDNDSKAAIEDKTADFGKSQTTATSKDAVDITVADLIKAGFRQNLAPIVVAALGIAEKQNNDRLARYLYRYMMIKRDCPSMPESWCAVIAGFPILAQDTEAPSLSEVAKLALTYSPFMGKEARKQYQKAVKPILLKVLAEVQTFLQNAADAGGFPIALTVEPPPGKWDFEKGVSFRPEDSLEQGLLNYMVPSRLYELSKKLPVEGTWAVILFDIISRLPNPDKQKGKAWKNWQLTGLLYKWFATAPQDFAPPLPEIGKKTAKEMPHSLAEVYTNISDKYESVHDDNAHKDK